MEIVRRFHFTLRRRSHYRTCHFRSTNTLSDPQPPCMNDLARLLCPAGFDFRLAEVPCGRSTQPSSLVRKSEVTKQRQNSHSHLQVMGYLTIWDASPRFRSTAACHRIGQDFPAVSQLATILNCEHWRNHWGPTSAGIMECRPRLLQFHSLAPHVLWL